MGRPEQDAHRDETEAEKLDRNWNDILQELRVMQTGTQLVAGFLLTLPFTTRFDDLTELEEATYLTLVLLAGLTLAVMITPISIHRRLFGEQVKDKLVSAAHRLLVVSLGLVGVLITGIIVFIFQVVIGTTVALAVGGGAALVVVLLLVVLPIVILPRRG
jgi:hypothetical protein